LEYSVRSLGVSNFIVSGTRHKDELSIGPLKTHVCRVPENYAINLFESMINF